ncbi:MAG: PTS sugar transporter subunit IIA [Acidiferrobacterales bacterium]
MIGILILTLGRVGEGLLEEASMIMGKDPEGVRVFNANCNQPPEVILDDLKSIIEEFHDTDGVLILADIYGATHVNAAMHLLEKDRIELVAGVNLPMLVRVLNYRDVLLHQLVAMAVSGGKNGVLSKDHMDVNEAKAS